VATADTKCCNNAAKRHRSEAKAKKQLLVFISEMNVFALGKRVVHSFGNIALADKDKGKPQHTNCNGQRRHLRFCELTVFCSGKGGNESAVAPSGKEKSGVIIYGLAGILKCLFND
jgi:hypothetical protein